MNIKHLVAALVAKTTLTCGFSEKSHAVGLDFEGLGLNIRDVIPSSYGDIAGQLDVTYRGVSALGNNSSFGDLQFWDNNYSDLQNVAYSGIGITGEVGLAPAEGYQVTLRSFDLGAWRNVDRGSQVYVYNGDFSELLFSQNPANISGTTRSTFNFNLTSDNGFRIQWGPDAFNVGIDNIKYDVSPVPEPLTILGSLAAIGVGGFLKREYNRKNQLKEKQS
jgi:hypothetical protein